MFDKDNRKITAASKNFNFIFDWSTGLCQQGWTDLYLPENKENNFLFFFRLKSNSENNEPQHKYPQH
jgi:hypothetical protein